jgi:hypothetical protein
MSLLFGTVHWDFVEFEPDTGVGRDGTMTLAKTTIPGIFEYMFGRRTRTKNVQFRGGGTVWYSLPGFKRQGTFRETMLVEFWKQWEYESKKAC